MKLQNLSVIFVIIVLPIILVTSYYISLQIDTINMQTAYNQKLIEATKDAIQAFETNTVEWNEAYSETGDSKRRDVMAAMNTFVNSFANNLGMAGASKEELLPYIPAIAYIGYDGYYIYAPSEEPITVLNENEVTVLLNEKLVKVGGTPEERTPICIKNFPPSPEAVEYIDGIQYNNADKVEKYEGSILYEWEDDASKNIHLNGKDGEYLYIKKDKNGTEIERKIISFTLNPEYAKKEYKHILKQYMPYSARYDNGKSGTQKIDITVNYTLDNYVTISGIVNGEYVKKSGYFQGYWWHSEPHLHYSGSDKWITSNFHGLYSWEKVRTYFWPQALWYTYEELSEYVWYNGLSNPQKFTYVYENENNTKVYIDKLGGGAWEAFQITSKGERINLDNLTETKYKKIYTANTTSEFQKMYLMALNGPNKGTYYNSLGNPVTCRVPYTYESSANNYFVEAYEFTKWLHDNLDSIKPSNCTNFISNEDYEIFLDMDPEAESSDFFSHKSEIIKQCIISGLNQAITSYSRNNNNGLEYKLPILTEREWEQALSNVSIIAFAQQIPTGMKYFNSYSIATSTVNKEYVSTFGFYMYHKNKDKYHLQACENFVAEWESAFMEMGGCSVYRNVDFVAKSYEVKDPITGQVKKHYYYLHSDDIEATQGCYKCVMQRQAIDENDVVDDGSFRYMLQSTAYYNALARERYVSHEFLDYEWIPGVDI